MLNAMKSRLNGKIFLQTICLFLLVTQICFAQWYQQNSGTTNHLLGVSFTDANTGMAVGDSGIILRTINGGTTWTPQTSGTTECLSDVSFTDENNGTVVGGSWFGGSTILRTTNGGTTWTPQVSGTTESFYGVCLIDANNGWVVGASGTILRTTNGGTTWIPQTSGTTHTLFDVSFTDANNGWVVGGFDSLVAIVGIILHTTNAGSTWIEQMSGITQRLEGVSFTDANNGWVVGTGGIILRTTNGGTTWIPQTSGTYVAFFDVSFTDANNGTATGAGYLCNQSTILRTTDGGQNWIEQSTPIWQGCLFGVSFTDENNGTVVGVDGIILHTTNGGVPVELTSFTATTNGKEVILKWSTATELNNQLFEVQRSFEGSEFATIGYVYGKGTTTERQDYSYSDEVFTNGKYSYRLKQIDYLGSYEYSDVVEVEWRAFNYYLLEQNYPNPFNPTTTIGFGLQNKSNVKITILNSVGEEVAVLLNKGKEAGYHQVELNATNLPSGVYFYQLKAGDFISTKKMILMK